MNLIPRSMLRNGWTVWHLLGAAVMAGIALFATWDVWQDIYNIAVRDEESSHIFLVPIVVLWLMYVRRKRLRYCAPTGLWVGPLIVAVGWLAHSVGDAYMFQSIWHGGVVLVVLGAALSCLGLPTARAFAPALIALVFLVPIPGIVRQQLAMPLQTATAIITEQVLLVMAMPIDRAGNVLTINGVEVAIAEACNGLRMVFALTLVSYTLAFSLPLRSYVRAILIVASPVSAVLCNVIRLIPTVWIYGYADVSIGDTFHDVSGWIMLGVSLLLLMGIIAALRWALVPVTRYTLATN
ncbi:exosortase/archaeosortase family protein [Phycisphaerales bacterium AB-hyl4]|uniref:Exosortase/archaeosortase family protein n=1 Tax=Natronomicrosphaera hydrolytica TaxID=3242702 RepID=A0ABV4U4V2_9BACT